MAGSADGVWIAYVDSMRTPLDVLRPPVRDALIPPASFGVVPTCAARVFGSEPVPAPADSAHVCIVHVPQEQPHNARIVARFEGSAPGLAVLHDRSLVLVYQEPAAGRAAPPRRAGRGRIVVRRGAPGGRDWSDALPVCDAAERGSHELLHGRLAIGARGPLIFPEVWRDTDADTGAARIVCHRSQDGGRTWSDSGALRVPAGSDPVVQEIGSGRWLMLLRRGQSLARSSSEDGGRTWSAPVDLGIPARATSAILGTRGGTALLAWTDPDPDTTFAPPGLQSLRLAQSHDAGRTWSRGRSLLLRPGRLLLPGGLEAAGSGLRLVFEERSGASSIVRYADYGAEFLADKPAAVPSAYSPDARATREALRIWCAHTLARPRPAQRLFVEAYFMRSLVAAHEALAPFAGRDGPEWIDTRAGIDRALAFADSMVAKQDRGLWSLGYHAIWWADMGAAVGLFPMLEPYTDEEHLARYRRATSSFLKRLEAEGMILDSGAIGVGREKINVDGRSPGMSRDPYIVSTALCGIEAYAWLYHRSHEPRFKQRALAALDYTLAQIESQGFREEITRKGKESDLRAAGYVQEGWMAADAMLEDDAVLQKLKQALPPHIAWLLRTQRPDGTWDSGADGESARTPAIIDFLIWYDQRCEARQDVRRAVRSAASSLIDRERWPALGLYHVGDRNEVLRAIAGRPLAALAGERWVR